MTSLQFSRKRITPAYAKELLASTKAAGFTNRPLSDFTVKKYTHDMAGDNFHADGTGETIKIATIKGTPVVIDGQTRLAALIEHGKPMHFLVCEGVDVSMFKYIDGGKPRTLSDLMSMDGSPLALHAKEYAVTGYMLYKEDKTQDPRKKPDADNFDGTGSQLDFIKAEYAEDMASVMERHQTALRCVARNTLGAVSLWAYFMVRMEARDKLLAAKFLNYVANYGEAVPCSKNLLWAAKLSLKLREEHQDTDGTVKKARYKDFIDGVMDAWALAWNLCREGTHLKSQSAFTAKYAVQHDGNWPGIK